MLATEEFSSPLKRMERVSMIYLSGSFICISIYYDTSLDS